MHVSQPWALAYLLVVAINAQAASFSLDKSGQEPLYQTVVPLEVYQAGRSHQLQDLVITNAKGEQVPYALFDDETLHPQTELNLNSQTLKAHAVSESQLSNTGSLHIKLNQTTQNASVDIQTNAAGETKKIAYLIDAGEKHPAFKTIRIDWQGNEGKLLTFEVLASDNLKNWHSLGTSVLIKVASDSLIQNAIEIDGNDTSRYLQIRPADANATVIKQVRAEYLTTRTAVNEVHQQGLDLLQREQDTQHHVINLDYEAKGRYPAQLLKVGLPQINTVTSARFYVRNKPSEPWQYLTTSSLYRIEKNGKQSVNPDVQLNSTTARYWRIQFDEANGGLGAENPTLSLAWRPQTIVWNARGNGPFTLSVGENPSVVNVVTVQSLMTDYQVDKVLQLPKASVGALIGETAGTSTKTITKSQDAWTSPPDYKSWMLWAGLALGVIILSAMAYSLLKTDAQER